MGGVLNVYVYVDFEWSEWRNRGGGRPDIKTEKGSLFGGPGNKRSGVCCMYKVRRVTEMREGGMEWGGRHR